MRKPTEDLAIALKSEVLGEAFFRSAYYSTFFFNRGEKVKVLWQLEVQTKSKIIEYFEINRIETPKLRWIQIKGSVLGFLCQIAPWNIILKEILKETEYYLGVFRRLEEQATEQDKELFKYIVAHEVAIGQFAEIELVSSGDNSLNLIKALLNN